MSLATPKDSTLKKFDYDRVYKEKRVVLEIYLPYKQAN